MGERKNHEISSKRKIAEFQNDALVVHSGQNIGDGKIVQVISGGTDSNNLHAALYLDFGAPFGKVQSTYYTRFPIVEGGVPSLVWRGVLPSSVHNDCRDDLPEPVSIAETRKKFSHAIKSNVTEEEYVANIQFQQTAVSSEAIFVSHMHPDHDGFVPVAAERLPIITSPENHAFMQAEQKVDKPSHWLEEKVEFTPYVNAERLKEKRKRHFIEVPHGEVVAVGGKKDIEVTLLATSHLFGSSAAEVTFQSGNRILYTSDLSNGDKTDELMRYLDESDPFQTVIVDATHVGKDGNYRSEEELSELLKKEFTGSSPKYIKIFEKDFTRLKTVVSAAEDNDRQVYIPYSLALSLFYIEKALGYKSTDLPDLSKCKIIHVPDKTRKSANGYSGKGSEDILTNQSFDFVDIRDLHANSEEIRRSVIVFTKSKQLEQFEARRLFRPGNRLINSSINGQQEMKQMNSVLNSSGMSLVALNALHHQNTQDFKDFLGHIKAENVILLPKSLGDGSDSLFEDIIKSSLKQPSNIIFQSPTGAPLGLDGTPLDYTYVSAA